MLSELSPVGKKINNLQQIKISAQFNEWFTMITYYKTATTIIIIVNMNLLKIFISNLETVGGYTEM
jgi:hypothetical protein